MKNALFPLLLLMAGVLAATPLAADQKVMYVNAQPAAGLALWGNSQGQYGWSGSISLGPAPGYAAPVYAAPAYITAAWPAPRGGVFYGPVHGPACGKAPHHHRRHAHRHHGRHSGHHRHRDRW